MATSGRSRKDAARQTFPVTVRQLPVVRCDLCDRTLAHRPGEAGDVLTRHYEREHPTSLPGR